MSTLSTKDLKPEYYLLLIAVFAITGCFQSQMSTNEKYVNVNEQNRGNKNTSMPPVIVRNGSPQNTSTTKGAQSTQSENGQQKNKTQNEIEIDNIILKLNEGEFDTLITSPEDADHITSELTNIACHNSIDSALKDEMNGILLLGPSVLYVKRDIYYNYGSGHQNLQKALNASYKCNENLNEQELHAAQLDNQIQYREVAANDSVFDLVITSPKLANVFRSALTLVSCYDTPTAAINSKTNGIKMLRGSSVLIKRDINYIFGDGSSAQSARPLALIRCK